VKTSRNWNFLDDDIGPLANEMMVLVYIQGRQYSRHQSVEPKKQLNDTTQIIPKCAAHYCRLHLHSSEILAQNRDIRPWNFLQLFEYERVTYGNDVIDLTFHNY